MNASFLGLLIGLTSFLPGIAQDARGLSTPSAADPDAPWIAWSDSLLGALADQDVAAFDKLVDMNAVLDRAFKGVECPAEFATGFRTGVLRTTTGGKGTYAGLTTALEQGARFDFIRLRGDAGARTALFRLVPAEGGVDYWEYALERKNGRVRAIDLYMTTVGEQTSSLFRRWLIPHAAKQNQNLLGRLLGDEATLVEHWDAVERVIAASQTGDVEAFASRVEELPADLRSDKPLILMKIRMYPPEDPRYFKALADLRTFHPKDPCTHVHSIDYFWIRGEHSEAFGELERLRQWVGGDPYLHHLRANLHLGADGFDAARKAARQAIDDGLDWIDPYWTMLAACFGQERFEESLAILKEIDGKYELEWNDFSGEPMYAGFVKSPQHRQWLEYLRTKPPPH